MSTADRSSNTNRPLRPTLAPNRPARTPLTPRVAANATPPTRSSAPKAPVTVRSDPPTPRVTQVNTPINSVVSNGNVTPRSYARSSRPGSANASPTHAPGTPSAQRPKSAAVPVQGNGE